MAEHLTTTPSGLTVCFEDGLPDPETGKSKRRSYLVDGEKLVSVTTVLGVVEKPGLQYAAEKLTVAGCLELARNGGLPQDVDRALGRLGSEGLRFRQIWDRKADMGTLTHEELVALAIGSPVKPLSAYLPEEQGFIRGVAGWHADYRPEIEDHELMVASPELGVAGRLDARLRTHRLPGLGLWDYKTISLLPTYKNGAVKPPYDENLWQVEGYERLAKDSGYGPTDYRAILRVDSTGAYDVTVSWVDESGFLAALALYREKRGIVASRPKAEAA